MSVPKLFQPIKLGNVTLQHRVVLAPMTRMRCTKDHIPTPIMKDYYSQRSSTPGTLVITEATPVSLAAGGMPNVPGIYNDAQIAAWKEIIDAVHAKGSFLFLQLWATGRAANPTVLAAEGKPYVAPSPIKLEDKDETPRELSKDEIEQYVEWFAQAARNAIEAGADGVEIHGANGYLIDQFLRDVSNQRTDEYGGSIENRCRFPLQIVDAVVKAIGPERTAIRLNPWGTVLGMTLADPVPQFTYFVQQLAITHPTLAYIHVIEARVKGAMTLPVEDYDPAKSTDFIRDIWAPRPLISCGAYSRELAIEVAEKKGDLIAVGRPFASNPDLPERWKNDWQLTPYKREFFYIPGGSAEGYSDYPFATEAQKVTIVG
ncbi:NADH:flavin oxidoreductase/NADH oxidase [Schizophyllum commune Loenen D]|nr:NADH:flavin oxidoreductase/NADH oxidase [Schizophyllum commune Loenen D]